MKHIKSRSLKNMFSRNSIIGIFLLSTAIVSQLSVRSARATDSAPGKPPESAAEKLQEGAEDAGKNIKKGYRAVKDKACEMINGKLECVGKKAMNKARNAKDEMKDKADDLQKKVD